MLKALLQSKLSYDNMPWRISDLYISLLVFITFIVSKLKEKKKQQQKTTKTNEREIKNKI